MRRKIRRNRQLAPGTDCETKEEVIVIDVLPYAPIWTD